MAISIQELMDLVVLKVKSRINSATSIVYTSIPEVGLWKAKTRNIEVMMIRFDNDLLRVFFHQDGNDVCISEIWFCEVTHRGFHTHLLFCLSNRAKTGVEIGLLEKKPISEASTPNEHMDRMEAMLLSI